MMTQEAENLDEQIRSYEALEDCIRKDMDQTTLSYREISAAIDWSHTQLWSFHRSKCRLQFEVLGRLAILFNRHYVITNVSKRGQHPVHNIGELATTVKTAITESMKHGISYRKIGRITNISHEWIRCFHSKNSKMDARKIIAMADYLGVYYILSNEKELKKNNKHRK